MKASLGALAAISLLSAAQGGVVAHYTFDSDFTDSVGSNDLLADGGTPTTTTTASEVRFGTGALSLDGSSDLNFTSSIAFGVSDEWSVSFWGKRASDADFRSGMVLGTTDGFIWTPDNPSVVRGIRLRINGDNDVEVGADDAQYHHWVVTADSSGFSLYRDNILLDTQASATNVTFDEVGTGASAANIYDGSIDELYIFDEAIDAAVIESLFTSNTVPEPSPLALIGLTSLGLLKRRRRS